MSDFAGLLVSILFASVITLALIAMLRHICLSQREGGLDD